MLVIIACSIVPPFFVFMRNWLIPARGKNGDESHLDHWCIDLSVGVISDAIKIPTSGL